MKATVKNTFYGLVKARTVASKCWIFSRTLSTIKRSKDLPGANGRGIREKYFEHCGVKTKDTIGTPCEISLVKEQYTTKDGEQRQVTKIKYFNLLDENNKPIIMYKIRSMN